MILHLIARATLALFLLFGATVVTASASQEPTPPQDVTIADLLDADGNQLGYAIVFQDDDGVTGIAVVGRGFTPGEHGVHIHETGNCDPAGEKTFEQAGTHLNLGHTLHPAHTGDLGNLIADEDGEVVFTTFTDAIGLGATEPTLNDADGSALVVHEQIDDLATDPTGNSGARIACAVLFPPA